MENTWLFHNVTPMNGAYSRQRRLMFFSDLWQWLLLAGGGVLMLLAGLLALRDLGWLSVLCLCAGLALAWFRPVMSYRELVSIGYELRVDFDGEGFSVGGSYIPYTRLTKLRLRGKWLILEHSAGSVLLLASGFDGIRCEDFLTRLQDRHPQISLKKSRFDSVLSRLWPLFLTTILGLGLTAFGFFYEAEPSAQANLTSDAYLMPVVTVQEEDGSVQWVGRSNDDRLLSGPLKTADFDLFSMDIPDKIYVYDYRKYEGGGASIIYYKASERMLIQVDLVPTTAVWHSSLELFARSYQQNFGYAELSISAAGNLSREIRDVATVGGDYSYYFFWMEKEGYYITVALYCRSDIFEDYLPHFRKWEASVVWNDPPTGELLGAENK